MPADAAAPLRRSPRARPPAEPPLELRPGHWRPTDPALQALARLLVSVARRGQAPPPAAGAGETSRITGAAR